MHLKNALEGWVGISHNDLEYIDMPINTRPIIPVEPPPIPPDVLDPIRYRFGGFVYERDMQGDNIVITWPIQNQPTFYNLNEFTYYTRNMKNP